MKKNIGLFLLVCSIISTILVLFNLNYVSLIISILSIVFGLFFFKNNRIFFVTFIISICCIVTNCFIIYVSNIDVLKDKNILLGSWLYNDIGGTYIFNEDYSYYQYIGSNTLDNYCVGKYEYKYGGTDNAGKIVKQDNFYYYYTLNFKTDYCVINGNKDDEVENNRFVFSVNKDNYEDIIFMDTEKNNAFIVSKINE